MSQTQMIDFGAFERSGVLDETEYNRLSSELAEAMAGVRVQSIRKALKFEAASFDRYKQDAIENDARANAPVEDPDMAFDLAAIPITVQATFNLSFFPEFTGEYLRSGILNEVILIRGENGFAVAPTSQFRSLVIAQHELITEMRKRFIASRIAQEVSGAVEIDALFLVPATVVLNDMHDEMTVMVTFFILFDD